MNSIIQSKRSLLQSTIQGAVGGLPPTKKKSPSPFMAHVYVAQRVPGCFITLRSSEPDRISRLGLVLICSLHDIIRSCGPSSSGVNSGSGSSNRLSWSTEHREGANKLATNRPWSPNFGSKLEHALHDVKQCNFLCKAGCRIVSR